ncbi:unnamed protein product [Heligmosomoides polygyrus]|uniref:MYND-type domain-containing protein n=1 Tax=Heligmosomoides polygyrus TaxID=6339 RepID=A0A3P8F1L4_HELPZ|nr:unnamed protein product [Heligmosomoides polygyrus]
MNTGRKRRSTQLDENSNPDTVDMQPGNAKVPRLRRSRSLRVLYDEVLQDVQEVRQQVLHHGDAENSRSVTPAPEEARDDEHPAYDGADEVEVRGFDEGNRAVNARNGRCQREILDYRQKLLYYANFKLHFGISDEMCGFMENFCDVMTSSAEAVDPEKNKYENIILAGIMFTRKPPTETLLVELFSDLKHELEVLQREGIPIHTASDTWICTPKLVNGIIDFAALQTLYGLPRWQSLQGCHLCMFPGERVGRRVLWFNRFPDPNDRRTDESLILDAEARQNGLRGWTQMMDFFTVNQCMPDALHLLSEGITSNVFRAMFGPRKGTAVLAIRRDCFNALLVALQRTRNYTYSSKFILGVEDLSRRTRSEKEALSFAVFPLAAALNMFSESVGAVAVLAYWMLVRVLENTRELTEADFPGVRDLGSSMKNLCFLLHKDMVDKLEKEVKIFENHHLDRLHKKIAGQGRRPRCNVMVDIGLEGDWYVPADSVLAFEGMGEEDRQFLLDQILDRLSDGNHMYASSDYWKKSAETDTTQGVVYLETPDEEARFGQVIAFGFDSYIGDCCVLLEEFVTADPFAALYE